MQQRKADGVLSSAWGWSGLLRKMRRSIRGPAKLCRELEIQLPRKVSYRE